MEKLILIIILAAALACSALAGDHPDHPKAESSKAMATGLGALDGKVFVGEIGKKGEAKGDEDEFVFKNGTFVSTQCKPYGFHKSPYQTKQKNGAVTFTAIPVNKKSETMNWSGKVTKAKISGTAIYKRKGGWFKKARDIEYWFKGTLKSGDHKADHPTNKSDHPTKKAEHPEHPK